MKTLTIASVLALAVLSGSALAQAPGQSRAEVKAETKAAVRSGDVAAPGDSGKTLRESSPQRYEARQPTKNAKGGRAAAAVSK